EQCHDDLLHLSQYPCKREWRYSGIWPEMYELSPACRPQLLPLHAAAWTFHGSQLHQLSYAGTDIEKSYPAVIRTAGAFSRNGAFTPDRYLPGYDKIRDRGKTVTVYRLPCNEAA